MTPLLTTPNTAPDPGALVPSVTPGPVGAPPRAAGSRVGSMASCTELTARIRQLEREIRQARVEQLELIAEADRRRIFATQGARSTQVWLKGLLHIDGSDAKTRVTIAKATTHPNDAPEGTNAAISAELPATVEALAKGALDLKHASIISRCVGALPEHARHRAGEVEKLLVNNASRMCPRDLAKLADHVKHTLDGSGAAKDEQAQHESRELHYATALDGMLVIKARLDKETGAKFVEAIRPLSAPRPETNGEKDPRTPAQRNADGLSAMLDVVLESDHMPRTGGQRPHLTITIDYDDLKQQIPTNTPGMLTSTDQPITPETVRRIACDSEVLPMMLGGDSLPLDVGTAHRTAPPHIRAALLTRDGACAFPDCDRPPGTPQAHHIVHWIDGGPTTVDNMVMLCAHHHRTTHQQHWQIDLHKGRPLFTPPPPSTQHEHRAPAAKHYPPPSATPSTTPYPNHAPRRNPNETHPQQVDNPNLPKTRQPRLNQQPATRRRQRTPTPQSKSANQPRRERKKVHQSTHTEPDTSRSLEATAADPETRRPSHTGSSP
ncbi:DUF222 domain-containing protein [Saccharopolyspora sp. WRP15-2]|uniref:DUF222 domain-containing protein n=1 Tax=Saccharopolyspora oryzae TaxID=2997343 RepID=A0ABT4UZA2_9PSEU|nr:DUF222 domain-containing protein [Saccharopolyspora oryzae]MDA3627044.1 DUF222 domain-containing protein [Saccharopolyspora oryzae]